MNNKDRNLHILRKIIKYCIESNATIQLFGDSVETLRTDCIYKNATAMCVLQIGELVGHLSEDIIGKYSKMPWKQIRAMRNIAAHGYEEFDIDVLWQTLKTDLPALREYCEEIIAFESI
jgi:uncharacterized protein with HEPN domain